MMGIARFAGTIFGAPAGAFLRMIVRIVRHEVRPPCARPVSGQPGNTTAGAMIYSRCVDALASVRTNENDGIIDTAFRRARNRLLLPRCTATARKQLRMPR
jgi:hypothetical protein